MLPVEPVQRGTERHSAEDDQRHRVQHLAAGVDEVGDLAVDRAVEHAEGEPRHEGGDEAAASERHRDAVRQGGRRKRDHLDPMVGDQVPPAGDAKDDCRSNTGEDAGHEAPTDLVEHEMDRRVDGDRVVFGCGERERR